jgi:hypothetical protein
MTTWKQFFFKAMGFGVGVVLTLGLVAAGWYWYATRPRPWDKNAVKAKFDLFEYQAKHEAFVITFEYVLENTTNKDYTLSPDTTVFERMVFNSGYGNTINAGIVGNVFIPAKHQMIVKIQVPYKYEDFDTTFENTVEEKKSVIFAFKRLNRIDNFELFDKENKYEIDLPNEWAQWEKVKNAFADTESKPSPQSKAASKQN